MLKVRVPTGSLLRNGFLCLALAAVALGGAARAGESAARKVALASVRSVYVTYDPLLVGGGGDCPEDLEAMADRGEMIRAIRRALAARGLVSAATRAEADAVLLIQWYATMCLDGSNFLNLPTAKTSPPENSILTTVLHPPSLDRRGPDVTLKARLMDRNGTVLWRTSLFWFRSEHQETTEAGKIRQLVSRLHRAWRRAGGGAGLPPAEAEPARR